MFLAAAPLDTITQFFVKGGWFMIPLALCSLVSLTIVLLRVVALRRESVLPRVVENEIERFQPGGSAEQLARLVGDDPAALSTLTRVALSHLRVPRMENTEAVQTAARREIMRLEGGLPVLELIVGISPLLGSAGSDLGVGERVFRAGQGARPPGHGGRCPGHRGGAQHDDLWPDHRHPDADRLHLFAKRVEAMSVEMESLMADLLSKCYYQRGSTGPVASPADDAEMDDCRGALSISPGAAVIEPA